VRFVQPLRAIYHYGLARILHHCLAHAAYCFAALPAATTRAVLWLRFAACCAHLLFSTYARCAALRDDSISARCAATAQARALRIRRDALSRRVLLAFTFLPLLPHRLHHINSTPFRWRAPRRTLSWLRTRFRAYAAVGGGGMGRRAAS
jgi:hypothetical protein